MIAKYGGAQAAFAAGPAGQRIHYRDQGRCDGPAMILLHGSTASLQTGEPLVTRHCGAYRIVTPHLPGHDLAGTTPHPDCTAGRVHPAAHVLAAHLRVVTSPLAG